MLIDKWPLKQYCGTMWYSIKKYIKSFFKWLKDDIGCENGGVNESVRATVDENVHVERPKNIYIS